MKTLVCILGILLIISCGNNKKNEDTTVNTATNISSKSDSTSVSNTEKAYPLDGNYQVLKVKDEDVTPQNLVMKFNHSGALVTIETPCYNIRSNYEQNDDNIRFQEPIRTPIECNGKIEYEDFDKILPEVSSINKNNSFFNLVDAGGNLVVRLKKE